MKKKLLFILALMVSIWTTAQKNPGMTVINAAATETALINPLLFQQHGDNVLSDTTALILPYTLSSSTSNPAPSNYFKYQRCEYLITAAEMATGGFSTATAINAIGWQNLLAGIGTLNGTLNVYMKNTTDVTYNLGGTAWTITDFTQVYANSNFTTHINSNYYMIPFAAPFAYTGGGIYIAWEFSSPTGTGGSVPNVIGLNNWGTFPNVFLRKAFSQTTMPTNLNSGDAQRPVTVLSSLPQTDIISIYNVYLSGKVPYPYGTPSTIGVRVGNESASAATYNLTITVKDAVFNITRYTSTQTGLALAAGAINVVNFPSWSPTLSEDVIITVSATAAGETFIKNNTATETVNVNTSLFSYIYNTFPPNGFTGNSSLTPTIFASKFTMNGAGSVPGVNIVFANNSGVVGKTITPVVLNSSGDIVGSAAPYTVVTADKGQTVSFTLPTPVLFADEIFYAGIIVPASTTVVLSMFYDLPSRGGIN